MGGACGNLRRGRKKSSKRPQSSVIRGTNIPRRTSGIVSRSINSSVNLNLENQSNLEASVPSRIITIGLQQAESEVGINFLKKELYETLTPRSLKKYDSRRKKWDRMARFNPQRDDHVNSKTVYNKLKFFFEKDPDKFCERIGKGPPCEYRWLAWKIISGVNYSQIPGLYKELLEEADQIDENEHDKLRQINLDLNRTFPDFSFFSGESGRRGQELLKRSLRAYAMYNKEVGYTQSINFLMGFFLMVNGGNDEEAFWLFVAITKKNQNFHMVGNFEGGLEGFYADKFPLYHQFVYQFDKLFEKKIPKLKAHFDNIGYPAPVWLQKWFMTLFLYSFPMKLCIRLWDNLLVEGLVYIFKFPLAIMEILESTLLKCNFEEVNEILSNLRTKDDPDLQDSAAVLPSTEKIMLKARKIKLAHEELQALKKEYELATSQNRQIKRIKTLPKIMEEEDIYEEVKKMHSQSFDEDCILLDNDDSQSDQKKYERRNSIGMVRIRTGNTLEDDEHLYNDEILGNRRYRKVKSTMRIRVNHLNSRLESQNSVKKDSLPQNTLELPPIFDNKEQKDVTAGFLKNLSIESSFENGSKKEESMINPSAALHKSQKSLGIILPKLCKKAGRGVQNNLDNSLVNNNAFNSFSQSLGRYSSVQHIQHAHTDREIMEEISENMNESLDNFILNDSFGLVKSKGSIMKFRRVATDIEKCKSNSLATKSQENNKEDHKTISKRGNYIEGISHSEHENLQDSFQHANSDLFLESQKNGHIRIIDLESLDCSDSSSSDMEDSAGGGNSRNKTHDTIKAQEFHSPHNSNFINFN
ncbi:unnamed protein product [Moneuplotes crassus]|uniref:Rab-GAP TBC domain-containing protein n=1 Tax=Euplotes crassus TaxID=5936 RepID=A0AAD2D9M5_EUPCR|nr:unnamed protein product [Moneuplotes crassus]